MLFDTCNIFNLKVKPYSYPDIDEDLKYISTYVKGKRNKKDIRILMSGVKTGKKYFVFLKGDSCGSFLHFVHFEDCKEIDKGHYKFKSYNYYFLREDTNDVNVLLKSWVENNPLSFQFNGEKISHIDNYTYIFGYNGNRY